MTAQCRGAAAWISIIVGVAVLAGWILDIQALKSVAPNLVSMKANTLVVLQAAVGYLYGVKLLYGINGVTGMAVHTLVTLCSLCLGLLAARPRDGFMGVLSSPGYGGHVARRLTIPILVLQAEKRAQRRIRSIRRSDSRVSAEVRAHRIRHISCSAGLPNQARSGVGWRAGRAGALEYYSRARRLL
jgi:hypothetical protein